MGGKLAMRYGILTLCLVLALTGAGWAQARVVFDDVPPWHWAFDAVQKAGEAGIFVGYPTSDRDLVSNAITQVYGAFAHAPHPDADSWAARFLTRLPADWPRPLRQSRLLRFALENVRVDIREDDGTASFIASITLRRNGAVEAPRAPMRIRVQRDADGRWRIDYTSLAEAQPQVFR